MASGMLQLLFNVVGLIFIGNFGNDLDVAAIGATSQIINLLVNFIIGLSVGASVTLSKFYGANDYDNIHKTVHTSIAMSVVGGMILLFVGVLFSRQILVLMTTPEEIFTLSDHYIKIVYFGLPALMVYNFGSALICATGDSKRPLYFLTFAGVINIVLNLILVGWLKTGVYGVGIASTVSQYISAILIISYLIKVNGALKLDFRKLRIYPKIIKSVLFVGLPAGLQSVVFSISNLVIQKSINSFGTVVITGNTAANNLENFVYRAMNAIYQSMMTFYGQNFGAKQYYRLPKILFTCIVIVFVIGFGMGQSVYMLGENLLKIFTTNPEAIQYGMVRLSYIGALYFVYGILEVFIGGLRVLGYSIVSTLISFFGVCVFRIAWIYTIFPLNPTLNNLYLSFPTSWFLTCVVVIVCYFVLSKRVINKEKMVS